MPQVSLPESIDAMEKAGLITRFKDVKRVDELPMLMEDNPDTAIYIEHVKDCKFPFFANGYGARPMYALALNCDPKKVGLEIAKRFEVSYKPEMVAHAPCQEVVYKGDEVDLTMFPLFLYHPKDGHAYLNDTNVVSRNPENGLSDDWEVLGGYYGEPAKLVKCLTNELTIPANAEIVLEGRIITSEGWVHDEGPYGEYTGTYGGGLPHNNRFVVDCITHRKNAIYQYATIGGLHPGRTDMSAFQPAIEGDLYNALIKAGVLVQNVYLPPAGCSNIGYAAIKTRSGGDAKQALAIMLAGSRQWMPKTAYVFDDDIDIYNEERVKWAQAWRFNPETGIVLLQGQNMLPLHPSLNTDSPPDAVTKVGFDCTIPLIGKVDRFAYSAAAVAEPLKRETAVRAMPEDEIATEMEKMIREKPRSWHDILAHFADQPYPELYRAFGQLRPKLGRMADQRPDYPYTFSDSDFVYTDKKSDS